MVVWLSGCYGWGIKGWGVGGGLVVYTDWMVVRLFVGWLGNLNE